MNKKIIIVHHTAISKKVSNQFEIIDATHRRKGWGGIGYHYLGQNGEGRTGRLLGERGAHCYSPLFPKSWFANRDTIGYAFAGNYDLEEVEVKDIDHFKNWKKQLEENYGHKFEVRFHSDYVWTACPGKNLKLWLKNINVDNSEESRKKRRKPLAEIFKKLFKIK